MSRWVKFFIAISLGLVIGLIYGWMIAPVKYVDTAPGTLRADYRLDFVLMVAETYQVEQNLDLAARRLALLGSNPPAQIVNQALEFAILAGSAESDRLLLQNLSAALLNWQPPSGGIAP